MRRTAALYTLLGLALTAGCKDIRQRGGAREGATAAPATLPAKVGEADATGVAASSFDVDEKSGRPKSNLILRLDYFPDPKPGKATLPACYGAFPADFDLGVVTCGDKPGERLPLAAKNVEQDCYTDPKVPRTPAAEPVVLPGCKKGLVLVHNFEPKLRIDVEVRDVN